MSLIADHFDICDRCSGYIMASGVYRYMMRNSPHLCRCEEPNEEIPSESQCRLGGNQHAGRKVSVAGLVSRRAGARSPAATSELMGVTAGETAPTPVRRKLTITTKARAA